MERKEAGENQKLFAVTLVKSASDVERDSLVLWLETLLRIRSSDQTAFEKAKATLLATRVHKILWPLLKVISSEIKKNLWDKRSTKSRMGIIGVSSAIVLFGGQSAGVAALGGAIGVPLWIVFGAGATFAGFILEEIKRNRSKQPDGAIVVDYEVID